MKVRDAGRWSKASSEKCLLCKHFLFLFFLCEDSWSLLTSEIPVFRFRWTCIMWELVYGIHLCRQRGQPTLSIFAEQIGGFGLLQFPGNPVPVALEWRWSASCFLIRDLLQPPTCPFFFVGCFGLARTKICYYRVQTLPQSSTVALFKQIPIALVNDRLEY